MNSDTVEMIKLCNLYDDAGMCEAAFAIPNPQLVEEALPNAHLNILFKMIVMIQEIHSYKIYHLKHLMVRKEEIL